MFIRGIKGIGQANFFLRMSNHGHSLNTKPQAKFKPNQATNFSRPTVFIQRMDHEVWKRGLDVGKDVRIEFEYDSFHDVFGSFFLLLGFFDIKSRTRRGRGCTATEGFKRSSELTRGSATKQAEQLFLAPGRYSNLAWSAEFTEALQLLFQSWAGQHGHEQRVYDCVYCFVIFMNRLCLIFFLMVYREKHRLIKVFAFYNIYVLRKWKFWRDFQNVGVALGL